MWELFGHSQISQDGQIGARQQAQPVLLWKRGDTLADAQARLAAIQPTRMRAGLPATR